MTVPHSYLPAGASATTSLVEDLASRIARDGPMPFPDFMAAVLYDPARGYYAREPRQVGKGGDFFTSVSVGPVFGTLLARRFLTWWEENGRPEAWQIQETGAHDGTLAADVLRTIQQSDSSAFASLEYRIIEPLPSLAAAQRVKLVEFAAKVCLVDSAEKLLLLPGIIFGNELLDALPFHVINWRDGDWHLGQVEHANDRFNFRFNRSNQSNFKSFDLPDGSSLPGGYQTEIRDCYPAFLQSRASTLSHGLMLWIDYGFAKPDYYAPERTTGTLRTFSRHRAGEDPLDQPGEQDITAHVDFTAVADAAMKLGAVPRDFSDQGSWLTRLAGPWLRAQENAPSPAAIRQFQTLTHPAHLGARFQVLELSFGETVPAEQQARALQRLAL